MPLTRKGRKIKRAMRRFYGPEKGSRVFYASMNACRICGGDRKHRAWCPACNPRKKGKR